MFDFGVLSPEAEALLKVLAPKPLVDSYKITLTVEVSCAGQDIAIRTNVPLDGIYTSVHNVTMVSGLFREMSNDDIQWCLKDYPNLVVGKVQSFTPVIVKM